MAEILPGFAWGIVEDVDDPLGLGRVRVSIPGIFNSPETHPEWAIPLGWPGAGAPIKGQGSRYPMRLGATVGLFFEVGSITSPPAYLPAMAGIQDGQTLGPEAPIDSGDPNTVVSLWEDDRLQVYLTTATDQNSNAADRRFEIRDKLTGNGITFNVTDGAQNTSSTITLDANTSINLTSRGIINIDAGLGVQIQGRKVLRKPGVTSI